MNFSDVTVSYFSPTNTTKKICTAIADEISAALSVPVKNRSFTLPDERKEPLSFSEGEIVVLGVPVYAGRVPNFLVKYLNGTSARGAVGIPVVLYGNRAYDDALLELRDMMEKAGIKTAAAAAFIGEHSFSRVLAAGRPDESDIKKAVSFARSAAEKIAAGFESPISVKGNYPYRPYMVPQTSDGGHKTITKVFPKVSDACVSCGTCSSVCPLGCIAEDFRSYVSFCVKCCACVKACPTNARYFDDETYLFHKKQLEENFARRSEPEIFL